MKDNTNINMDELFGQNTHHDDDTSTHAANEDDTQEEETSYRAFRKEKEPCDSFVVWFADDVAEVYPYTFIIKGSSTSHQFFSFVFSTHVLVLKGRNLRACIPDLRRRRITDITEFDAAKHERPPDDKPIITSITVKSIQEFGNPGQKAEPDNLYYLDE